MPVTQISARQRLNAGGGGGGGAVTVAGITDAGAEGRLALLTTTQAELTALLAEATLVDKGLMASSVLQTIYNLGSVAQWSSVEAGDINGLAAIAISGLAADISDATAVGRSMLKATNQAAQTALIAPATTSLAGLLAAVDKTKLDGLSNVTLPVSLANGGTGQITALAAMDALSGQGADIAGGNTVDLATVTGPVVVVTGGAGVTISSFGTRPIGAKQTLIFASSGAAIIHNGAALICPFGASIGVQAGDIYEVTSMGSGAWRVTGYLPVTAAAWKTALGLATLATTATAANITDASTVGRSMLTASNQAAQTLLIAAATTGLAGLLSAADKTKLNGLATLATTPTAANITDATTVGRSMLTAASQAAQTLLIAAATTSLAGLLSSADKTKLDGLATLASTPTAANITDATTVGRSMLTASNQAAQTLLIAAATTSLAGLMSAADKIKVNAQPVLIQSFSLQSVTTDIISTAFAAGLYRRLILDVIQGTASGSGLSYLSLVGLTGAYKSTFLYNSGPYSAALWSIGWNGSPNSSGRFIINMPAAPALKTFTGQSQLGQSTVQIQTHGGSNDDTTHEPTALGLMIYGAGYQLGFDLYGVS